MKRLKSTHRFVPVSNVRIALDAWDTAKGVGDNVYQMMLDNALCCADRKECKAQLETITKRYFADESLGNALAILEKGNFRQMREVLFFFALQGDATLKAMVSDMNSTMSGYNIVKPLCTVDNGANTTVSATIYKWALDGAITRWSEATISKLAHSLTQTLDDFGVVSGRWFIPPALHYKAFAFIAFWLKAKYRSSALVMSAPELAVFGLTEGDRERLALEAHFHTLLEYNACGSVSRLEFEASNIEEYARFLSYTK